MLPFYKIKDTDVEGMDFIALVDNPAHMKAFQFFNGSQEPIKMQFNDEKRIVMGVAIAVDLPIYRRDSDIGEHYVVFDRKTTSSIWEKMMKSGYMHNVNEMHDSNKVLKGVSYLHSFEIDRAKGVNPPLFFENQNLKDGSIIVSYKVDNDKVWQDIKSGKHVGFSIEGWFGREKINIKTKQKMSKQEKSLFEKIFGKKSKFAEAELVDGTMIYWEGDLAEGIEIKVKDADSGDEILAGEGTFAIMNEDGSSKVIVTDGNSIVVSVEEVPASDESVIDTIPVSEEQMEAILNEFRTEFKSEIEKAIAPIKEENEKLKEANAAFSTQIETLVNELDKDNKKKFNTTVKKNWKQITK